MRKNWLVLHSVAALCALTLGAPAAHAAPPGTNDFKCKPTAAHPRPLVMLEGLGGNSEAWRYFAPTLKSTGYCLFTLDYGVDPRIAWLPVKIEGSLPIEQSAAELDAFVDKVLAATQAEQVDILGHSEGTIMPRYYMERLGGAPNVKRFVALTPLWRGTTFLGVSELRDLLAPLGLSQPVVKLVAQFCTACTQALRGSAFLADLNKDGEAIPGIDHTNILTKYDELVTPYTSGLMRDGGKNIVLQDVCPNHVPEHIAMAFDSAVLQLIKNALDPAHATRVRC